MIKPQDLRIGNLMNWNGCICPAVSIEENGFTVVNPNQEKMNSNYHYSPDEVIVGWQLTEEWLVKFGFDKDRSTRELLFNYIIYFERQGKELFLCNNQTREQYLIEWVHEAQNLYLAFTGDELTLQSQICD